MITKIKPKEQKILSQAQNYLSHNNAAAALELLLNYSRNNKLSNHGTYLLAISYAISGRPDKTKELALKLIKNSPNEVEYLKLLGSCNHDLKQYNDAIKYFKRAVSIYSTDYQALSNLASSLKEVGEYEEAEKYFTHSLKINSNQPDALTNFGLVMQLQNKIDDAITLHQKALHLIPNHNNALYNLAYSLREKGNQVEALNYYNLLLKAHPNHMNALRDAAQIYAELNQPENALSLFTKAEEITPDNEEILQSLGVLFKTLNMDKKAELYFKKALNINPNNQVVHYYLAMINGEQEFINSPETYVQGLFDSYAETFDNHLVSTLEYRTPQLISNSLKSVIDFNNKYKILDLGCGTGLAGLYLKDIASIMTGIDLSPKMIKKAKERNIYSELIVSGIEQYLESQVDKADIIIAADVFVYIGDIGRIFSLIPSKLHTNGIFVFSTESTKETDTFTLGNTGRFSHNPKYITQLATENGLKINELQEAIIRRENNKPVNGHIYLLTSQ